MNDASSDPEEAAWATASTLAEALPFIQIYDRETVVIKYGGHAMGEEAVAKQFAADAVLLKLLGPAPGGRARRRAADQRHAGAGRASSRPSSTACASPTQATMEVAEMVLSGAINKEIANWITAGRRRGRRARRRPFRQGRAADHGREAAPHPEGPRLDGSSRRSIWASSASRRASIPSCSRR